MLRAGHWLWLSALLHAGVLFAAVKFAAGPALVPLPGPPSAPQASEAPPGALGEYEIAEDAPTSGAVSPSPASEGAPPEASEGEPLPKATPAVEAPPPAPAPKEPVRPLAPRSLPETAALPKRKAPPAAALRPPKPAEEPEDDWLKPDPAPAPEPPPPRAPLPSSRADAPDPWVARLLAKERRKHEDRLERSQPNSARTDAPHPSPAAGATDLTRADPARTNDAVREPAKSLSGPQTLRALGRAMARALPIAADDTDRSWATLPRGPLGQVPVELAVESQKLTLLGIGATDNARLRAIAGRVVRLLGTGRLALDPTRLQPGRYALVMELSLSDTRDPTFRLMEEPERDGNAYRAAVLVSATSLVRGRVSWAP